MLKSITKKWVVLGIALSVVFVSLNTKAEASARGSTTAVYIKKGASVSSSKPNSLLVENKIVYIILNTGEKINITPETGN